jgi:hypothetical protein
MRATATAIEVDRPVHITRRRVIYVVCLDNTLGCTSITGGYHVWDSIGVSERVSSMMTSYVRRDPDDEDKI